MSNNNKEEIMELSPIDQNKILNSLLGSYHQTNTKYIDYDRVAQFIVDTNPLPVSNYASNYAFDNSEYRENV